MAIELTIADDWDSVESVREKVASEVLAAWGEEMSDALSMVAAELLENAVKYGIEGAPIRFALDDDGPVVAVSNVVDGGSLHPATLRARIEWVRSFPDPADAWMETMARVYQTGKLRDSTSCLGILRIAYEGRCSVSCEVDGTTVTVRARWDGKS
jgi:hypothetical protein